jgi:hypothetical protein
MLACQMNLLETQCQVGFDVVEASLGFFSGTKGTAEERSNPDRPPEVDFQKLEALAIENVQKGFAPPKEIYSVPYRNRMDWSRFPPWARPIDPEVFEGSGHEG